MKISFEDKNLKELIENGKNSKYKKFSRDRSFMNGLSRVVATLSAVSCCNDLRMFSWLHYEQLRNVGVSSVRVLNGRVERLIFRELNDGIEIVLIELNRTHYGNKK